MYIKMTEVQKMLKDKDWSLEVCSEDEDEIVCRLNDGFESKRVRILDINRAKDE